MDYVNRQPLAPLLTCLGDGHEGIWNIIGQLNPKHWRREILDWYHLIENLHKVGGCLKRLAVAREFLWQGPADETINLFKSCRRQPAKNFCIYLQMHRQRKRELPMVIKRKRLFDWFKSCRISR